MSLTLRSPGYHEATWSMAYLKCADKSLLLSSLLRLSSSGAEELSLEVIYMAEELSLEVIYICATDVNQVGL